MIDAQELRIGNIVFSGSLGESLKISGVNEFIITLKREQEIHPLSFFYPENIFPIPLTEAVLRAVGCEKKTCGYGTPYLWNEYLFKNEGHMNFDKQGGGWVFKRSLYGNTISIAEVAYLHQLQNLIFCLTNEELEINMEELKKAINE